MPAEPAFARPQQVQTQTQRANSVIAGLAGRQHGVVARNQLLELELGREAIAGRVSREAAMDAFQRNQSAVKDAFSGNMFTDLAKRNMAMFEDAAQAFSGKPKSEARPSSSEVEQLKADLAALQAKVDRLSR